MTVAGLTVADCRQHQCQGQPPQCRSRRETIYRLAALVLLGS